MRHDYATDPTLLDRVFKLYEHAWPGMTARAEVGRRSGMRWEESTPFLLREGERVISHVGVLDMNLVVGGRPLRVGGIHAVVTHPDRRGGGHMRALMEEALAWCDARYGTTLLLGDPPLYERFGFRSVPEHRFAGNVGGSGGTGLRPLDRSADFGILLRLLDTRAPVSRRLGIVRDRAIFLFDTALWPLHYAADLDAVIAYSVKQGVLRLYDVVAERTPPLDAVLARIPEPFERVEVYFAPDGPADLAPEPHPLGLDDFLMVRGPWPVDGPAMLPVPARC